MSEAAANPFNSASDPSKLQFYIGFRQFRPDFLSVFHGEDTVSPQELRIDCNFPCQEEDDELIKNHKKCTPETQCLALFQKNFVLLTCWLIL